MKYLLLACFALFVTMRVSAQDAEYMKLRSTILPSERDEVGENGFRAVNYVGQHTSSLLSFNAYGSTGIFQMEATFWGSLHFRNKTDGITWTDWRTIWHSGNLDPTSYFSSKTDIWNKDWSGRDRIFFENPTYAHAGTTYIKGYGSRAIEFRNENDVTVVRIGSNGDMGVGTTNTMGYKLAVAGSMIAEKVKVKMQSAWPDYVFRKDYPLPSLQELEGFIRRHQHLPEMPDEKEVAENGVDLGEMNRKLLQKVEELTLYIIQQDKEVREVKKRMEVMEKKLSSEK